MLPPIFTSALHLPQAIQAPLAGAVHAVEQPLYLYKETVTDNPISYLGYINEVAGAFNRFVTPANWLVGLYALYNSFNRGLRGYEKAIGKPEKVRRIEAYDYAIESSLYQGITNVWGPLQLVQVVREKTKKWLQRKQASPAILHRVPTAVSLLAIPLIVKPLDKTVQWLFDKLYVPGARWVKGRIMPEVYGPSAISAARNIYTTPLRHSKLFDSRFL